MSVEASVELLAGAEVPSIGLKFSAPLYEINVALPLNAAEQLLEASSKNWDHGSIRLGSCAGASVCWCAGEPGFVSIMVGHDDETWDVAIQVPVASIEDAVAQARVLAAKRQA